MKPTRYRFGDCRLDVAARELWRADERVALAAKAFECLAYLIEHRDRAVGRDELVAAVWGRVDGSDSLLTQAIWRARRAIGDSGSDLTNTLRTVPRFGYRWAAPVQIDPESTNGESDTALAATAAALTATPASPSATKAASESSEAFHAPPADVPSNGNASPPMSSHARSRTRRPLRLLAAAAAVLAAVLAIVVGVNRYVPQHDDTAPDTASLIVVLPVGLADTSTETAWLRFGAMDYVASRLREARLGVMPSERVVAIAKPAANASGPDADERTRLLRITGAHYLLVPRATRSEGLWHFAIEAYHADRARTYRADAATPLEAADGAAASFLADLGTAAAVAKQPGAIDELVQRVDAATLASDVAEARRWLDATTPEQRTDPRIQVRFGRLALRNGQLEDAETALLPLAQSRSDLAPSLRAVAQMGLAGIAVRRHRYSEAEPLYNSALATLGENGDAGLRGRAYGERAIVNGGLGRLDLAIADMGRARSELERSGDPIGSAYLDINAGLVTAQRGRYGEALGTLDRAIAAFDRYGIADGLATALANKANLQLGQLDAGGAVASSARAWTLLAKFEDHRLIEFVAQNHIRALRSNGRLAEAALALDRFDVAGDHASADPMFATLRAALLVDQGKGRLALQLADDILDRIKHAPAGSCSDTIPEAALVLTQAALQSRRADSARPLIARLGEFVDSPQKDPSWGFATELARGLILAADADPEADRHFAAALALADSQSEPDAIVAAVASYAAYLSSHGDRARAAALLAHVEPYADRDYRAARAAAQLHLLLDERDPAMKAEGKARALAGERIASSP